MTIKIGCCLLIGLGLALPGLAQDKLPDLGEPRVLASNFCERWAVNVGFYTSHPGENNRPKQKQLNRVNPGLGLVCRFSEHWYVDFDYIEKNSHWGKLYTAGIGADTTVLRLGSYSLNLGAEAVLVDYEYKGKGSAFALGPALTASLSKQGWPVHPALVLFPSVGHGMKQMGVGAMSFFVQYVF